MSSIFRTLGNVAYYTAVPLSTFKPAMEVYRDGCEIKSRRDRTFHTAVFLGAPLAIEAARASAYGYFAYKTLNYLL